MSKRIRNRHFFLSDLISLSIATYLSFVLRLDRFDLERFWPGFMLFVALLLVVAPLIFYRVGVYTRYWRYASVDELWLMGNSMTLATLLVSGCILAVNVLSGNVAPIPRSVPFIFLLLALLATAGPRLIVRLLVRYEHRRRRQGAPTHVLVMGAGDAGEMIVRQLREQPRHNLKVIGFLDDDASKHRSRIHGVPVLGDRHAIPSVVRQFDVRQVIIAMPQVPGKVIREIAHICEQAGVKTKTIPHIHELIDGNVSLNQLRDIQIDDLLRREAVQTDIAAVRDLIYGKRVLVTGGGGSIGSELCRQVLRCEPSELIVLGHGENSVFEIHSQLLKQPPVLQSSTLNSEGPPLIADQGAPTTGRECQISAVIADVRFPGRINAVFEQYRPEIVFHAAAHKHVPLMELNPIEVVTNNILGTLNVLRAAQAVDVKNFVLISTDKAVKPTSLMGASKRVCELLVHQAAIATNRPYVAVRFGNVLGSRGSVVLTFKQQVANGGPVTVTEPEVTRFFMTIPEAVQLVLQAAVIGQGGEVFTLDMGKPIRIVDLARDIIELSGLEVGRDIDIVFTGLRPGEKLYEELFVPGEKYERTLHEKLFIARNASSFIPAFLDQAVDELRSVAESNDPTRIAQCLQVLVPELHRPDQRASEAETRMAAAEHGSAAALSSGSTSAAQ